MMATMVLSLYLKQRTIDRRGQGLVGVALPIKMMLITMMCCDPEKKQNEKIRKSRKENCRGTAQALKGTQPSAK